MRALGRRGKGRGRGEACVHARVAVGPPRAFDAALLRARAKSLHAQQLTGAPNKSQTAIGQLLPRQRTFSRRTWVLRLMAISMLRVLSFCVACICVGVGAVAAAAPRAAEPLAADLLSAEELLVAVPVQDCSV